MKVIPIKKTIPIKKVIGDTTAYLSEDNQITVIIQKTKLKRAYNFLNTNNFGVSSLDRSKRNIK